LTEEVAPPFVRNVPSLAMAGPAFVLGVLTGLLLPRVFREIGRLYQFRAARETVVYDENLPPSLARREPAPAPQQPRFGGTGSLGVSPRAYDGALGHVESTDPSQR